MVNLSNEYDACFTLFFNCKLCCYLQVFVNQQKIYPAYSNSVLRITSTDIITTLELQDISAKIVYSGSSFSIDLPYSLFEGNTEGQCGELENTSPNL